MVYAQDDHLLLMILFFTAIILPGIVLWFDDAAIHELSRK